MNRIWAGKFLGDSALGALSIAAVILVVISSFSMGLTIGTGTVISQYFGAHKTEQLKKAASSTFLLLGACAILATAAIFLFGEWLPRLMHTPEAILTLTNTYLSIVGANFAGMIIAVMGIWAWRVAGIFMFRHFFGLEGVWYGLAVSYVLAGMTAYVYYLSGRWKDKGIV